MCIRDRVIAGPAFNAGRYGAACGAVCAAVQRELNLPAVTAMYPENPGTDIYKKEVYILPTGGSAASTVSYTHLRHHGITLL